MTVQSIIEKLKLQRDTAEQALEYEHKLFEVLRAKYRKQKQLLKDFYKTPSTVLLKRAIRVIIAERKDTVDARHMSKEFLELPIVKALVKEMENE